MSIPSRLRKPGAKARRNEPYRGSVRRHATSGRPAIDRLVKEAAGILASCPFDIPRNDLEAAMDYLASDEYFTGQLDLRAESLLRRSFAGPGDSAFEEIIVDALTVIQERLAATIPSAPPSFARMFSDN